MPSGPLAHLRIVDLTDLRAALAGRLLADLGADVLKIEPPAGDPDRRRPPGVAGSDDGLPFLYRHANKRGAVLDLQSASDRARLDALCRRADVLLENLAPPARAAADLSPAAVQARHPHLVHVAIADFGLSGPRAGWRLEALPAFAASGALYGCGLLDRPPCWLPGYVAHDAASTFAAYGALAAVLDRARHGAGQTVEVSVQEAAIAGLTPWSVTLADYNRLYPMLAPAPPRNADGNYLVLPVADGFVRVLPATPRHWRAFVALLGNPEVLAGPEFENAIFRMMSADVIRLVAGEALAGRARRDVVAEGRRTGVPIAPVNTPDEFVAEEQTQARGYFRRTGFPVVGDAPMAVAPIGFSRTPVGLERPAPPRGATEDLPPGTTRPATAAPPTLPLAGVRVLSLGVVAVGPEVGWLLAELGAEVIKVESQTKLDPLREVSFEPGAWNKVFTFNDENRGHESVCLDLRTPGGRELALALAAQSDVVIENNRGGVARAWGLDYADVCRVRPDVVYLASQGYGRTGPLGETQGFGPLNGAFAGAQHLWNFADAPYPAGSSLNHPDHVVSKLGAVAVLAALEHRRRTGEGQLIDLAQTECAAFLLGEAYLEGPLTGTPAGPQGNAVPYAAPHGVYPCAGEDRWIAIAVVGEAAWTAFCDVAGWAPEAGWETLDGRVMAREALDARVAAFTATEDRDALASRLQEAGVSAMPVLDPDDLRADAHLAARGAIVTLEHPEVGSERHAGNAVRFGRSLLRTAGPAPLLGEHTQAVLQRVLGMSPEAVQALVDGGVCR